MQTFAGRDAINGLPVRLYSFMGEPKAREGELISDFIPPILSSSFSGAAGEVVSAFSGGFRRLKGAVEPRQVEALLRETAAALDDAARAGVVHGDLSPERVFFDREAGAAGRFILEGYGVPWPVRPSEFSAPERIGGASFAGDIFSWARTVKHLSGPLPGDLRDLLDRCLSADPAERPHAREVRAALERYPFSSAAPKPNRQTERDTSAFEHYADSGGYTDDEDDADDGLAAADDLSTLTLPPKTVKLGEYRRQQARSKPTPQNAIQPTLAPTVQGPVSSPPEKALPPVTKVKVPLPKETLKQLDATEAYRARLAAHRAQHGDAHSDVAVAASTEPVKPAVSETPTASPRPAVRVIPEPARPNEAPQPTGAMRVKTYREPHHPEQTADESGTDTPDFEVIDDIDDRAPDPTLYRGGRRVLLLTLLGIALLVLLALQLINA